MHFHIFANLKNQIRPHFSLSCIFFDNSGVNFARKCWHFLQIWGITFVCNKTARAVTANLCQKAQIAKSWKYFLETWHCCRCTRQSITAWRKSMNCRKCFFSERKNEDSRCSKCPESVRILMQSLTDRWILSQEQLTQESMEGVEAAEGETSWGRPRAQVMENKIWGPGNKIFLGGSGNRIIFLAEDVFDFVCRRSLLKCSGARSQEVSR